MSEENNDNNLQLPAWEEIPSLKEMKAMKHDLSSNWLDYTLTYPEPRFLLEYAGVPFAPLGGIQAITGHQKNGKTFLMCQFMAAILSGGDTERMRANLPTLQLHQPTRESLNHEPVILYVDTEMEKLNTVKVVRRVQWLCNLDYNVEDSRLKVLWLRAELSNEVRWEKIKQAIIETHPTAIFLDGIRDVIGDFNDNKESADLISECMQISTEMDCCFFSVLHENPGSDKMRGHLGTELSNKVTDTFVSIKDKKDGLVTFTVKQVDARGKDVDDWKFEITSDAGSLGVPRIISSADTKSDDINMIKEWITKGQQEIEWPAFGKDIKEMLKKISGVSFNDKLQANMKAAVNRRFLIEQPKEEWDKGQKHPKYYLNEQEILPF